MRQVDLARRPHIETLFVPVQLGRILDINVSVYALPAPPAVVGLTRMKRMPEALTLKATDDAPLLETDCCTFPLLLSSSSVTLPERPLSWVPLAQR